MAFTDMEDLEEEQEGVPTPAGRSNRNFWLIFGILGGVLLLALICMGVYAVAILPRQRNNAEETNTARVAMINETAVAATQTKLATYFTPTSRPPTDTPILPSPTRTSVIAAVASPTGTSVDSVVETRSVMQTQAAETAMAVTPLPTSTSLPDTGFADDVGMPGLLGLAAVCVVVIFLVRRLRASQA